MKRMFAAAIASLLLLPAGTALAGDLLDAAANAEQLMKQGEFDKALAAVETAKDIVWQAAPMSFRKALFAAAEPQGVGIYDIKEGSTFKRKDPLIIYSEPVGYGYGRDGELYVIDLALDFTVNGADGKVVAHQENFGNLTLRSRVPNKEFMAKVTYDFSGLAAGDYEVITKAKDKNSDKTAEFSLKFTLVE